MKTPEERMKASLLAEAIRTLSRVVVFYHLPGCVYCEMSRPALRSEQHVLFVNADEFPGLARGIDAFPTTRVYVRGKLAKELIGKVNKKNLEVS